MNEPHTVPAQPGKAPAIRNFWMMFIVECQNAFSDNLLKFLVIFIITGLKLQGDQYNQLTSLVAVLFALPFIFFSMAGGFFADRFSKRNVTNVIKCAEIGIMSLACFGFWQNNLPVLLACIFLMSTHSAIFGPAKYGMLPELLPEKKLSWGNGVFSLGTFGAIIVGSIVAGLLSDLFPAHHAYFGLILVGLALTGLGLSFGVTPLPAADPQKKFHANIFAEFWGNLKAIRRDRVLFLGVIGNAYLWSLGALLQLVIFSYASKTLQVDDTHNSYLQAALAIGLGVGSFAAGFLSGQKIEYGLVPLGMTGLTISAALLARHGITFSTVAALLGSLGFFGGLYSVPLNAIMQQHPDPSKKGEVIATASLLSWIGIFFASGLNYLLTSVVHLTPSQMFLAGALLSLIGAIYCIQLLPDSLLRFALWLLTKTIYRIRVEGRANVPERGGALLVCNHVSLADAFFLIAALERPVRFLMLKEIYDRPSIHWGARLLRIIPVSPEQRPREMLQSLQVAADALKNGELVCIFAEGQITRTGQLLPFRRGFERIMKNVDAPIVPVGLNGVWGSIFSFEKGKFLWKWPRHRSRHISVSFGPPLPATATPFEVRQVVQELLADTWNHRQSDLKPLHRALITTARQHPRRLALADAQNKKVTFGAVLLKSIFLARRLRHHWSRQKMVGIFLPPSVPGALVNHAALLGGKVPVNLNYTLSESALASCVQQCSLQTIVTSRLFLEKIKLKLPGNIIYLEDLVQNPRPREKITAWLSAKFAPAPALEHLLADPADAQPKKITIHDLATIIFSSGSTGDPKGVMLSHANLVSNIEQLEQVFNLGGSDRLLGILPLFHSFGFMGTLALPAVLGVGVVFHPNPLDSKSIGVLVREHAVTFLLATPTFLQIYLRGCAPADFGSLRLVMTGAEKLPDRLALAFEEHFGIRPLEGYGCTECSPAVSVNTYDYRAAGFRQIGAKRGTIGHPLPGVSVRIVPVDQPHSETNVPLGQPGLMLIRGPNVMCGYLNRPEKTAEVLHQGWYCTGDVATLDEDGFLQITDRLNRFSKIGGEMVPHIKIEEKLHELTDRTEPTFVVTGVPDEKKGERLVVLHRLNPADLTACLAKLAASDLPNLWKPKADSFFPVAAFPLLGAGKLDLRQVKDQARQFIDPACLFPPA
jgi:acyl-[acyl-carrier-protein]-phospholipid O-acyltransferase/long-chain-fatty-acid--[acyl-carrier-protein] ligase